MSSSLIVPVTIVDVVKPHPNADKLEIIELLGWQCCAGKGEFKPGDRVVYFPPDCVLPQDVSDALGVTQYLSKGRVRQIRLRGEPSFGFAFSIDNSKFGPGAIQNGALLEWYVLKSKEVGENVADFFKATKYEPPVHYTQGNAAPDMPEFQKYTDIENIRHYNRIIVPGTPVVITEKLHGMNFRFGLVRDVDHNQIVCGSHKLRRAEPASLEDAIHDKFWFVSQHQGVKEFLTSQMDSMLPRTILYGEIYGKGIQSYTYDSPNGLAFRLFDIMIGDRYLNWPEVEELTNEFSIPRVPELYRGPFSVEVMKECAKGQSVLGGNIKEGVVVKPLVEMTHPKVGRVILKYLSDDYLLSKHSDFTDV